MSPVSDDAAITDVTSLPPVRAFTPLRHRDFRLLWSGLVISNVGSWMQFVALGYLVDRLTQSPLYLGILAVSQAIPRILFSIIGGAIADRMDRRWLLFASNLFLACTAVVLTVLTVTGRIQIWEILTIGALNAAAQAFDMPARHSLVPSLVEDREVLNAINLNAIAFNGAGVLGPSIGGVVIALIGEAGCFFLNAVSFLAVFIALLLMAPLPKPEALTSGVFEDIREGFGILRTHSRLLLYLSTVAIVSFFGRPYIRMMPTVAREMLHVQATGLGLLQSAPGVGTISSAFLIGWLAGSGKGKMLVTALMVYGISIVAFGFVPWFGSALLLLVVIGLAQALVMSAAMTLVQLSVPDQLRGRIMGMYGLLTFGGFALGSLPVGALAGWIGIGPAIASGGVVLILVALLLFPHFREID